MEEYARDIPSRLIDPAPIPLRPVNKLSQAYLYMVSDFTESQVFNNSILVRPRSEGRFEVVDGMYRWTAGHEAGMQVFQCTVREMSDSQVLVEQIRCNATRRDTDPIEYARHLRRLMDLEDKTVTLQSMAELTGRSRSWICEMMALNNLLPEYQTMVTRGQITVGNAQLLAKLKPYLQPNHVEAAKIETTKQFKRTVSVAINCFRESLKTGNMEKIWSTHIIPHMQRMKDIHHEMSTWQVGAKMIVKHGCISPLDGWKMAILWIMSMDPEELESRRGRTQRAELEKLKELEVLEALRDGRKLQVLDGTDNS